MREPEQSFQSVLDKHEAALRDAEVALLKARSERELARNELELKLANLDRLRESRCRLYADAEAMAGNPDSLLAVVARAERARQLMAQEATENYKAVDAEIKLRFCVQKLELKRRRLARLFRLAEGLRRLRAEEIRAVVKAKLRREAQGVDEMINRRRHSSSCF